MIFKKNNYKINSARKYTPLLPKMDRGKECDTIDHLPWELLKGYDSDSDSDD